MDNRTFIAIILCLIFYLAYSYYLNTKYPPQQLENNNISKNEEQKDKQSDLKIQQEESLGSSNPQISNTASPQIPKSEHDNNNYVEPINILSPQELILENNVVLYQFEQEFAAIKSIKIKEYKDNIKDKSKVVDFVDGLMLAIQGFANINFKNDLILQRGFNAIRKNNKLIFWKNNNDWKITQEFNLSEHGYGININIIFENLSNKEQDLDASIIMFQNIKIEKNKFSILPQINTQKAFISVYKDKSLKTYDAYKYCEAEDTKPAFTAQGTDLDFIGIDKHYFLGILSPKGNIFNLLVNKDPSSSSEVCKLKIILTQPQGYIKAKEQAVLSFVGYWGPKEESALSAVNEKFKHSIDLGWFGFIGRPLLWVIKGFYKITSNYGVAIIILTICLKLLFYPLTKAAAISSKKLQKLQPELNKIKERYKDDKAKQQQEMMAFMAKHKINPMKGCLPILPQIPVFIAFYNVLSHAIELRHAPFVGWINDLSSADPYFILPILLGVGMFIQQKITPNPGLDKTQEKILLMMPVIFTVMMLTLPSGLVIYMLTNIILSIIQQYWLNKTLVV